MGLVVAVAAGIVDRSDDGHAFNDTAEHGVLGGGGLVPEIKEAVVHSINEELGSWREAKTGQGQSTNASNIVASS